MGLDEVVDHFTLVGDELNLLRKSGATRLGFAALLKVLLCGSAGAANAANGYGGGA